jgi:transcriptional regulator with GAF, ATPase, and Fis domain
MTVPSPAAHQNAPRVPAVRLATPPIVAFESRTMADLLDRCRRVARSPVKVILTGESGVGKDLIARYIHACSARAARAMVTVNCAAFSETLLESELFGHVRGSFTGAHRDKVGKFQLAHLSTIFLDEIGEMSPRMQALLLRVLENGEIQPVGADGAGARVDVRVIAATNRDLAAEVAAGRFREDLMYRINVASIHVPPLRERPEDIPAIVRQVAEECGFAVTISPAAMHTLQRYRWPGNVRELQNVIAQALCMASGDVIDIDDLPASLGETPHRYAVARSERRRQIADDLFNGLVEGRFGFWDHLHRLFLNRDITRHDVREVIRRGLAATHGSYRGIVKLFRMDDHDYKRLLNFLAAHECTVDCREFRESRWTAEPELPCVAPPASDSTCCSGAVA